MFGIFICECMIGSILQFIKPKQTSIIINFASSIIIGFMQSISFSQSNNNQQNLPKTSKTSQKQQCPHKILQLSAKQNCQHSALICDKDCTFGNNPSHLKSQHKIFTPEELKGLMKKNFSHHNSSIANLENSLKVLFDKIQTNFRSLKQNVMANVELIIIEAMKSSNDEHHANYIENLFNSRIETFVCHEVYCLRNFKNQLGQKVSQQITMIQHKAQFQLKQLISVFQSKKKFLEQTIFSNKIEHFRSLAQNENRKIEKNNQKGPADEKMIDENEKKPIKLHQKTILEQRRENRANSQTSQSLNNKGPSNVIAGQQIKEDKTLQKFVHQTNSKNSNTKQDHLNQSIIVEQERPKRKLTEDKKLELRQETNTPQTERIIPEEIKKTTSQQKSQINSTFLENQKLQFELKHNPKSQQQKKIHQKQSIVKKSIQDENQQKKPQSFEDLCRQFAARKQRENNKNQKTQENPPSDSKKLEQDHNNMNRKKTTQNTLTENKKSQVQKISPVSQSSQKTLPMKPQQHFPADIKTQGITKEKRQNQREQKDLLYRQEKRNSFIQNILTSYQSQTKNDTARTQKEKYVQTTMNPIKRRQEKQQEKKISVFDKIKRATLRNQSTIPTLGDKKLKTQNIPQNQNSFKASQVLFNVSKVLIESVEKNSSTGQERIKVTPELVKKIYEENFKGPINNVQIKIHQKNKQAKIIKQNPVSNIHNSGKAIDFSPIKEPQINQMSDQVEQLEMESCNQVPAVSTPCFAPQQMQITLQKEPIEQLQKNIQSIQPLTIQVSHTQPKKEDRKKEELSSISQTKSNLKQPQQKKAKQASQRKNPQPTCFLNKHSYYGDSNSGKTQNALNLDSQNATLLTNSPKLKNPLKLGFGGKATTTNKQVISQIKEFQNPMDSYLKCFERDQKLRREEKEKQESRLKNSMLHILSQQSSKRNSFEGNVIRNAQNSENPSSNQKSQSKSLLGNLFSKSSISLKNDNKCEYQVQQNNQHIPRTINFDNSSYKSSLPSFLKDK